MHVLLHFVGDNLNLLCREVDVNCEASILAMFDAKLGDSLLNRVLWVHEVEDLVPQALSLHLIVTLRNECPRHCDIQVHDARHECRVDDTKIL